MVNENLRRDIKIIFRSEIQRALRRDISSNEELDTAKLLYDLYNRSKGSEEKFKENLREILYKEIPANSCDYLAFDLFMRIGDLENAFSILNGNLDKPNIVVHQMDSLRILKILVRAYFLLNNNKYEEAQLKDILDKILSSRIKVTPKIRVAGFELGSNDPEHRVEKMFDKIINLIDEKRLNFLEKRIGGEIFKEDIEIIEKEIKGFNLSKDLQKTLILIKNYNPKNEQEYAQNTGSIRSFLESIIKELSLKVSVKREEPIKKISEESEFMSNKAYLKNNDILDESEKRLLGAIYNILSSGGGSHILATSQEKYRLLLNMCIEMIVLILSNFKKKIGEVKSESEKARELLGGKSEGGFPILFGDAKQKLKQLGGYGGRGIEEMREKLRKEIEEDKKNNLSTPSRQSL